MLKKAVSLLCVCSLLGGVLCAPVSAAVDATQTEETQTETCDNPTYESNVEFIADSAETSSDTEETKTSESVSTQTTVDKKEPVPLGASYTVGNFTYEVIDNSATITKYSDSSVTSLTIPETLGGYSVTAISDGVFKNFSNLATISFPDTITRIGYNALYGTAWLSNQPNGIVYAGRVVYKYKGVMPLNTNIILRSNTVSIANAAFFDCVNLTSIDLGESLQRIDASAFKNCTSLNKIVMPDSVTYIDCDAFRNCASLRDVTLPSKLETISAYSFGDCTSLINIKIPSTIKTVKSDYNWADHGPFEGCTNLTDITFESGTTKINEYLFKDCSGLVSVTIPSGVNTIETSAFRDCVSLKNVSISNTVTKISTSTFKNCTSLEKIVVPDSVTYIDNDAFRNCASLRDVTLPSKLETISAYSFGDCTSLRNIKIPSTIKTVKSDYNWADHGPFEGCTNLTDITFESGTKILLGYILKNVAGLKKVTIPSSVEFIENYAFEYSANLEKIYILNADCGFGDKAFANLTDAAVYCPKYSKTTINLIDKGINVVSSDDKRSAESIVIADTESYYMVKSGSRVTFICNYKIKDDVYENVSETSIKIKIPENAYIRDKSLYYNKTLCTDYTDGEGYIVVPVTGKSGKITFDLEISEGSNLNTYAIFNYTLKTNTDSDEMDFKENTAYVRANNDWDNLYCYMWNSGSDTNSSWPGVKMSYVGNNIYSYTYDKDYENIIFNNGDGDQTDDLIYPGEGNIYNLGEGDWDKGSVTFVSDYDIIDVLNEELPIVSLNTESLSSSSGIEVGGIAPVGKEVKLYVDGELVNTVTANKAGNYNAVISIPSPENNKIYTIKAESVDNEGNAIYAESKVKYQEKAPVIKEFVMEYNGSSYNLLSDQKQCVTFRLESFHGVTPFKFIVKYDNYESIDSVFITSNRDGVTKTMTAKWDESQKSFIAEGFFDDDNHDYVPGRINVYFTEKTEKTEVSKEWVDEQLNGEIPEGLQKSEVKLVKETEEERIMEVTLENNDVVTYTYKKYPLDEFISNLENNTQNVSSKSSSVPVGGPLEDEKFSENAKIAKLITKYGWTLVSGKDNEFCTKQETTPTQIVCYVVDTTMEFAYEESISFAKSTTKDEFLSYVLESETKDLFSNTFTIAEGLYKAGGYITTWGQDTIDLKVAKNQIMSSTVLSDGEKEYRLSQIQEYQDKIDVIMAFKVMGSFYKTVSSMSFADPPAALTLWAVGFMFEDMVPFLIENEEDIRIKLESMFLYRAIAWAFDISWFIDPSGYVYAGVTDNRIADAKVTAYWLPFDETDENFWNSPDESNSQIWDASEYSQYNPLYTDADGNYAWDVPEGWWKVVVEKEGYETYTSEWLPVPPPQTDVNINLMSKEIPEITGISTEDGCVLVDFSVYMNPETIKNITITDSNGKTLEYTLEYSKDKTAYDGTVYSDSFVLRIDNKYLISSQTYTVTVNNAESYSGVPMNATEDVTFKVDDEVRGDINGDGIVDVKDVTALQMHLANYNIAVNENVLDVNGSGIVDVSDVTTLQMLLAGYNI